MGIAFGAEARGSGKQDCRIEPTYNGFVIGRGITDACLEAIEVDGNILNGASGSLSGDHGDDNGGREGGEGGCVMHLCELC